MSVYKPLRWFLTNPTSATPSGETLYRSTRLAFLFGDFKCRTEPEIRAELRAARRRNLRIDARLYLVPVLIALLGNVAVPILIGLH
ncbi:hypothetical protein CVS28_12645 [Arthrobacter glacialis]|nr:hypothetical protein CVS28_12645 [Arthrobacter glacialis]